MIVSRSIIGIGLILVLLIPAAALAANGAYSDGAYSACSYNSCGVTVTSNGTISDNVVPGSGTTCTTQSDSVAVTTDSSTGYTLSVNDAATSSSLQGSSTPTIPTSGGTSSAPSALTANTWGFRVDGVGGFGAGPTTASSNVSPSATTFAGIPTSAQASTSLVNSSGPADPAVTTTVWYGVCVNATLPAGTYQSSVVYTAVVN
jgi:hypothetical protein